MTEKIQYIAREGRFPLNRMNRRVHSMQVRSVCNARSFAVSFQQHRMVQDA